MHYIYFEKLEIEKGQTSNIFSNFAKKEIEICV